MDKKIGIGTKPGMMIGHDTTVIDRTEINAMIIGGMIGIMIIEEMMIVAMITVGIIETSMTVIIRQEIEMIGGHTRVIDIMMIKEGMMITGDTTMIEGRIIEDLKDLDSFKII